MIHAHRRRKAEKQRQEADLQKKVDALWREELEWVRQNPNPPLRGFRAAIRKALARRKKYHFPPLNIAMWPGQLGCTIDISDPGKFNDRYIEAPMPGRAGMNLPVLLAYITAIGFTYEYLHGRDFYDWLNDIAFVSIMLAMISFFAYYGLYILTSIPIPRTRYNRQAQLVHVDNGQGHVMHIPWRHVVPLLTLGYRTSELALCAPRSRADIKDAMLWGDPLEGGPAPDDVEEFIEINHMFSIADDVSADAALDRLEFLRRYMEHGIDAIQPDISHPTSQKELGDPRDLLNDGFFAKYIHYPVWAFLYYISFGPLIARRVRRINDSFEWSEEVKALCGPNPDLRGLDTRPVTSRTDVYYKVSLGKVFHYVDPDGTPYTGTTPITDPDGMMIPSDDIPDHRSRWEEPQHQPL